MAHTDKWERASDEALVADHEEDRPATKVQDMLREMMGGRNGKEERAEEKERRSVGIRAPACRFAFPRGGGEGAEPHSLVFLCALNDGKALPRLSRGKGFALARLKTPQVSKD